MLTATVASARRRSGWFALYSALSGVAFAVLFAFATMGFSGIDPWTSAAGLWQRLCLSAGSGSPSLR
jgi:hypothetical protein